MRFVYKQAYSAACSFDVYVNATLVASLSGGAAATTAGVYTVNIAGPAVIKFVQKTGGGQALIDSVEWTPNGQTLGAASSSSSALSSAASSMTSASSSSSSASSLGTSSSAGGGTVLTENMSLPQSVRDYYRSAYGLSGSALKSALHTISTGYTRYGYGWDQYTDIDAPAGVSASANQVVLRILVLR